MNLRSFKHPIIYSLKLGIISPRQLFKEFYSDLNKDLISKRYKSKFNFVWCAGLPKSGTTLLEKILNSLPYVQLDKSPLRKFHNNQLDHPHGISEEMFSCIPKNKFSFLKTHTHYSEEYLNIAQRHNSKIIITFRDLRDMMISNYHYIINNKNAWGHDDLVSLPEKEGFIKSLSLSNSKFHKDIAIVYYYNWIKKWIKVSKENRYLTLWYETYSEDHIKYINSVLSYLEFDEFKAEEIENNLSKDRSKELEVNINNPGRSMSTFNKGKTRVYKDFFDDEIEEYFCKLLPGSLDDIVYKG